MFADTHRYSLMGYWNDCKRKNNAKKYRTRDLPRRHGDTECHRGSSLCPFVPSCLCGTLSKKYRIRDLPRRHGDTECHGEGSSLCPFVPRCLCGTFPKKYRTRDLPRRHGDTECHGKGSSLCPFVPPCLCGTFRRLPVLLLMPHLPQALLALVGGHFVTLALFAAWHNAPPLG